MDAFGPEVSQGGGIGKRIVERRSAMGITQAKLAEAIDTSETIVSRWEKGKFRPSAKFMRKLANALCTTTSYLNGETDNPDAIEITRKMTLNIPVTDEPEVSRSEQEQSKGKIADYSLKMGSWGVSAERRTEKGQIKLEAMIRAGLKINALMEVVWKRLGGEPVYETMLDKEKIGWHLMIDDLDEQRDKEQIELLRQVQAKELKRLRKKMGLSIEILAQRVGLDPKTVEDIEECKDKILPFYLSLLGDALREKSIKSANESNFEEKILKSRVG